MLLRLAVLGTLGYFGYRQLQKTQTGRTDDTSPRLALAGGPLSGQARVQSDPDTPPSVTAAGDVVGTTLA